MRITPKQGFGCVTRLVFDWLQECTFISTSCRHFSLRFMQCSTFGLGFELGISAWWLYGISAWWLYRIIDVLCSHICVQHIIGQYSCPSDCCMQYACPYILVIECQMKQCFSGCSKLQVRIFLKGIVFVLSQYCIARLLPGKGESHKLPILDPFFLGATSPQNFNFP